MLAAVFVAGGVEQLRDPIRQAELAEPILARTGLAPRTAVQADGAVKVVAGIALALGRAPRLSALALAASLVPTTTAAHRFWETDDPERRAAEQVQFTKNVGLLGGLLLAAVDTEGKPSLGWRARRAADRLGDRLDRATPATTALEQAATMVTDSVATVADRAKEVVPVEVAKAREGLGKARENIVAAVEAVDTPANRRKAKRAARKLRHRADAAVVAAERRAEDVRERLISS
ncbi:DoxX family protein [Skermania piniformis]